MDLFTGPVDPNNPFANQIHDFNPGIAASGLFWTVPINSASVTTSVNVGKATMRLRNLPLGDFNTIPNSLMHGASVPATISCDVRWSGGWKPSTVRDQTNSFAGEFRDAVATCTWSAG